MGIKLLTLVLVLMFPCDITKNRWLGIIPLVTDKAAVESLLGKSMVDEHGYHRYETADAVVTIEFSTVPCEKDELGRGAYEVPANRVFRYWVVLKEMKKLTDFPFDREQYFRDKSGDLTSHVNFENFDKGTRIEVYVQGDVEYIKGFRFAPGKENDDKKCAPTTEESRRPD